MDMRRILLTHSHSHPRTVHNTSNHSNSSWFGMVGAGKCSKERAKHGPVGAGCIWQAPSPYRVLKQVDMRRILLTHSHARTVHNTPNHSTTSWFGMVGADKCSNERVKHGQLGARCLWQAPSPYRVLKHVDMCRILLTHSHSSTVHNTQEFSNVSWFGFGMVGAGKCSNERAKHGPLGAGCLWQAPSPYRVLKPVDMRRILVTHSRARTVHNTT
jgi:hypothetical protein